MAASFKNMLGDSAEKHAKEIEAANEKLKDLHAALKTCAKTEHHATLEERMKFVEKLLGESADKHDSHMNLNVVKYSEQCARRVLLPSTINFCRRRSIVSNPELERISCRTPLQHSLTK